MVARQNDNSAVPKLTPLVCDLRLIARKYRASQLTPIWLVMNPVAPPPRSVAKKTSAAAKSAVVDAPKTIEKIVKDKDHKEKLEVKEQKIELKEAKNEKIEIKDEDGKMVCISRCTLAIVPRR